MIALWILLGFSVGFLSSMIWMYRLGYKDGIITSVSGMQRFMKWMGPLDASYFKSLALKYNQEVEARTNKNESRAKFDVVK